MANEHTPTDDREPVRLRLDLSTRTAEFTGLIAQPRAFATELKKALAALVRAQDEGDAEALARAIAHAQALLEGVDIEWAGGSIR